MEAAPAVFIDMEFLPIALTLFLIVLGFVLALLVKGMKTRIVFFLLALISTVLLEAVTVVLPQWYSDYEATRRSPVVGTWYVNLNGRETQRIQFSRDGIISEPDPSSPGRWVEIGRFEGSTRRNWDIALRWGQDQALSSYRIRYAPYGLELDPLSSETVLQLRTL